MLLLSNIICWNHSQTALKTFPASYVRGVAEWFSAQRCLTQRTLSCKIPNPWRNSSSLPRLILQSLCRRGSRILKWGVNFCNNVIEPKPGWGVLGIRKKKKEGGSEKGEWKFTHFTSPGSAPALVGFMVSAVNSGGSGPGLSPGQGHSVVFLGKTLYSHSASLHPGVQMGTCEINAGGGVTLRWTSIPFRGGVEILLVASCYRNRDKHRPDGPLGSNADFTYSAWGSTPQGSRWCALALPELRLFHYAPKL